MISNTKLACVALALLASIGSDMATTLFAQGYPLNDRSATTTMPQPPGKLHSSHLTRQTTASTQTAATFSVINRPDQNLSDQSDFIRAESDSASPSNQSQARNQFLRTDSIPFAAIDRLDSPQPTPLMARPQSLGGQSPFSPTADDKNGSIQIDHALVESSPESSAINYESTTLPSIQVLSEAATIEDAKILDASKKEDAYTRFPSTESKPFKAASFSVVEPPQDRKFGFRSSSESSIPQNTLPSGGIESVPMSDDLSLSPPPEPGIPAESFLPVQPPAFGTVQPNPVYDPSVGHRRPWPVQRAKIYPLDDGEKFDFETKKRDFPPFDEIIATGRFFYSAEVLWAEPQFQGNTAIATEAVNFGQSVSSDFDSDFHPRVRFGFESKYGPGVEFSYFNINSNSEIASFTSDGNVIGHTNAWVIGRNVWSRIFADDPGEFLASQHSIDIDSATISFFKELKFPISRVNGNFGFQYVSIAQQLNANVTSASGATVETLQSTTDMRAFGPRAIIEYYRPIGHTPLELVTSFGGSVLFGQRDQFVSNSQTGLENRLGADEFLTIIDFLAAVQYKKTIGENRSWFARFGFMNQTWIGGGTAAFPQGDFGLRGLTFGIGYNR